MRGAVNGQPVVLRLGVRIPDLQRFLADPERRAALTGTVQVGDDGGGVLQEGALHLLAAAAPAPARRMDYRLRFTDASGRSWLLRGRKDVGRRSGAGPWEATRRG